MGKKPSKRVLQFIENACYVVGGVCVLTGVTAIFVGQADASDFPLFGMNASKDTEWQNTLGYGGIGMIALGGVFGMIGYDARKKRKKMHP